MIGKICFVIRICDTEDGKFNFTKCAAEIFNSNTFAVDVSKIVRTNYKPRGFALLAIYNAGMFLG